MSRRKWPIPVVVSSKAYQDDVLIPFMERHHAYGTSGKVGQWWAAFDGDKVLAAWLWTSAVPGSAKVVSPSEPSGALGLSRMAAVPGPRSERPERGWHLSKPLRWIMRNGLDRGRFPVLVSYSDAGQGHDGAVYRFSGWQEDGTRATANAFDGDGIRRSLYNCGGKRTDLVVEDKSAKTRWIHRVCPVGEEAEWMAIHGWRRVPTGRVWRSGKPAHTWRKFDELVVTK